MNPTSPLAAAVTAAVTDLATAAVSFGLFSNQQAATVVTAIMGLLSVGYIIVNEVRHHTNTHARVVPPVPAKAVVPVKKIPAA